MGNKNMHSQCKILWNFFRFFTSNHSPVALKTDPENPISCYNCLFSKIPFKIKKCFWIMVSLSYIPNKYFFADLCWLRKSSSLKSPSTSEAASDGTSAAETKQTHVKAL